MLPIFTMTWLMLILLQMNMYCGDSNYSKEEHGDRFDLVPWMIIIKEYVNDTELPGY